MSGASKAGASKGSGGSGATGPSKSSAGEHVCAFWVGGRCFGIDALTVGEIVSVSECFPVPACSPAVLGVFNLRGTPTVLVDFAAAMGLTGTVKPLTGGAVPAMILRSSELSAAVRIDSMDSVFELRSRSQLASATDADPLLLGVLEGAGRDRAPVVVLRADQVLSKLDALRFR